MDERTRTATVDDLPFLFEVDHHVSAQALTQIVDRGHVIVADLDGGAVGCLRWGLFWDQVPFMNLFWVAPPSRGHGVGTSLVRAWEAAQQAVGHELVLTSTSSAERAQHFYRQLGYIDSGSLLLPDEPTELILRKHLAV